MEYKIIWCDLHFIGIKRGISSENRSNFFLNDISSKGGCSCAKVLIIYTRLVNGNISLKWIDYKHALLCPMISEMIYGGTATPRRCFLSRLFMCRNIHSESIEIIE